MRSPQTEISVSVTHDRVLLKSRETTAERVEAFRRAYIEGVVIRPLLVQGQLCQRKVTGNGEPPHRYLVLISDDLSIFERLVTFFHELLHVQLLIAGVPPEAHVEDLIDETARFMANRFPQFYPFS